jgi:hypothetical protein
LVARGTRCRRAKASKKPAFKPLTIEQENAIDQLILGQNDREVAEIEGVNRMTVWQWRHEHAVFMAELERRRADVWRAPQEKLRSLMGKAVSNLAAGVEGGDLKASIELLKAVGMYGDGTMNAIGEQDPDNSTVVIWHAGTPMLPLAQAYYPDQDEGVCDGTTDY